MVDKSNRFATFKIQITKKNCSTRIKEENGFQIIKWAIEPLLLWIVSKGAFKKNIDLNTSVRNYV